MPHFLVVCGNDGHECPAGNGEFPELDYSTTKRERCLTTPKESSRVKTDFVIVKGLEESKNAAPPSYFGSAYELFNSQEKRETDTTSREFDLKEPWEEVANGNGIHRSSYSSLSSVSYSSDMRMIELSPSLESRTEDSFSHKTISEGSDDGQVSSESISGLDSYMVLPSSGNELSSSPIPVLLDQLNLRMSEEMKDMVQFKYCPNDGRPFQDREIYCTFCHSEHDAIGFLKNRMSPRLPWKKLLYVEQPYPDNYVDETFLTQMRKNVDLRTYDYWTLVQESGTISQHYSSILIFTALFIYTYHGHISDTFLFQLSASLTALGYSLWDVLGRLYSSKKINIPTLGNNHVATLKAAALIVSCVLAASPTLRTLTESTSSTTIWAVTVCLFVANLLFHDYGSPSTITIKNPSSLSLSAAIFASVLLASRLHTRLHVFTLITLALEWFALFPILRRFLRTTSMNYFMYLTLILFISTVVLFSRISVAVVVIYTWSMAFITFACPYWLIWIQRYKNRIHGPWDEAPLTLRSLSGHD